MVLVACRCDSFGAVSARICAAKRGAKPEQKSAGLQPPHTHCKPHPEAFPWYFAHTGPLCRSCGCPPTHVYLDHTPMQKQCPILGHFDTRVWGKEPPSLWLWLYVHLLEYVSPSRASVCSYSRKFSFDVDAVMVVYAANASRLHSPPARFTRATFSFRFTRESFLTMLNGVPVLSARPLTCFGAPDNPPATPPRLRHQLHAAPRPQSQQVRTHTEPVYIAGIAIGHELPCVRACISPCTLTPSSPSVSTTRGAQMPRGFRLEHAHTLSITHTPCASLPISRVTHARRMEKGNRTRLVSARRCWA